MLSFFTIFGYVSPLRPYIKDQVEFLFSSKGTAFFRHGRKRPYRTHRVTGHQTCIYCNFGPYILYFLSVCIVLVFGILYILLLVRIYFDTGPIILWYWSDYIWYWSICIVKLVCIYCNTLYWPVYDLLMDHTRILYFWPYII